MTEAEAQVRTVMWVDIRIQMLKKCNIYNIQGPYEDPGRRKGIPTIIREGKAEGPLFSANYMTFDKKIKIIKQLYSKLNSRYSSFLGFCLASI